MSSPIGKATRTTYLVEDFTKNHPEPGLRQCRASFVGQDSVAFKEYTNGTQIVRLTHKEGTSLYVTEIEQGIGGNRIKSFMADAKGKPITPSVHTGSNPEVADAMVDAVRKAFENKELNAKEAHDLLQLRPQLAAAVVGGISTAEAKNLVALAQDVGCANRTPSADGLGHPLKSQKQPYESIGVNISKTAAENDVLVSIQKHKDTAAGSLLRKTTVRLNDITGEATLKVESEDLHKRQYRTIENNVPISKEVAQAVDAAYDRLQAQGTLSAKTAREVDALRQTIARAVADNGVVDATEAENIIRTAQRVAKNTSAKHH